MRPDVFWLNDPVYMQAFRDLTGDTSMTEAAFTKRDEIYPGYVNAQLGVDEMVLTVRADPIHLPGSGNAAMPGTCGATAQIRIPIDDWDQFIAQAQMVRAGYKPPEDDAQLGLGIEHSGYAEVVEPDNRPGAELGGERPDGA